MVLKLLTLGLMFTQADGARVWMFCQPDSVRIAEPDQNHAWTCEDEPNRCSPRNYDLDTYERRGAEQVSDHSDSEDRMTVRSIIRIFDDGRFEETVEWRDAAGQIPIRQETQGRCVPQLYVSEIAGRVRVREIPEVTSGLASERTEGK
jgi:hypothetical protein